MGHSLMTTGGCGSPCQSDLLTEAKAGGEQILGQFGLSQEEINIYFHSTSFKLGLKSINFIVEKQSSIICCKNIMMI